MATNTEQAKKIAYFLAYNVDSLNTMAKEAPAINVAFAQVIGVLAKKYGNVQADTDKKVDLKWRFKTEAEFIEDFGTTWYDKVKNGWSVSEMNGFFGKEIPENEAKSAIRDNSGRYERWSVSADMITDKPLLPLPYVKWRIRTEKELLETYGVDWKANMDWVSPNMDELYGYVLTDAQVDEIRKDKVVMVELKRGVSVGIKIGLITDKPLDTKTSNKGEWRFKTEKEFLAEFGTDFRRMTSLNGNGKMDYLFGTELSASASKKAENKQDFEIPNTNDQAKKAKWKINFKMITNKPLGTVAPIAPPQKAYNYESLKGKKVVFPDGKKQVITNIQKNPKTIDLKYVNSTNGKAATFRVGRNVLNRLMDGASEQGYYIEELRFKDTVTDVMKKIDQKPTQSTSKFEQGKGYLKGTAFIIVANQGNRPSPTQSASEMEEGTKAIGNDGKWYEAVKNAAGIKQWKKSMELPASKDDTNDYKTWTQDQLTVKRKDIATAMKSFEEGEPEYEELKNELEYIDMYIE